jgi:predicted enzyme related to lactoylglutathione lyase
MIGEPSYIELGVRDADAARSFYGALLGWTATGAGGPGQVSTSTLDIGLHDGDESALFEVFFAVDDLAISLARLTELGGRVSREVQENPGFGRWAHCVDDQGVRFGLRQPPGQPPPR